MQPLRISITGNFWDSQIYRGRLYIWDLENAVHVFDWDSFLEYLSESTGHHFLVWAFSRGNELYQEFVSGPLFRDQDVRGLVQSKLQALSNLDLTFELSELNEFHMGTQASPFSELHDDLTIFRNIAYALNDDGFFSASIHKPKRRKYAVARTATKLWDGRGTSVTASKGGLAIAAAEDGLFEYSSWSCEEPERIAEGHASFANWLFASIYASSTVSEGYLAAYRWIKEADASESFSQWRREPVGILNEDLIFGSQVQPIGTHALTWGSQEKLYKASSGRIMAVRFTQKYVEDVGEEDGQNPFESIGEIATNNGARDAGDPLSAGASFFGSVVEYPDSIIVVESDLSVHRVEGAATRWRVFPRSHWYPNHLHIILEDRLDILSINGDLFADQRTKISGIEYRRAMLGEV